MTAPYQVYANNDSWIPFLKWYWITPDQQGTLGHGPFPFRWMASLSASWHTR